MKVLKYRLEGKVGFGVISYWKSIYGLTTVTIYYMWQIH